MTPKESQGFTRIVEGCMSGAMAASKPTQAGRSLDNIDQFVVKRFV